MRAVRNIVDTGRTVVTTIHQPSIDIFEVWRLLLVHQAIGMRDGFGRRAALPMTAPVPCNSLKSTRAGITQELFHAASVQGLPR